MPGFTISPTIIVLAAVFVLGWIVGLFSGRYVARAEREHRWTWTKVDPLNPRGKKSTSPKATDRFANLTKTLFALVMLVFAAIAIVDLRGDSSWLKQIVAHWISAITR